MKNNLFLFAALFVAASTILSSCSDDNDTTSKMPVFGELTVSPSVASPGDTLKATLTFSDQGSYVNGTYKYATNPAAVAGEFTCGSSKSETTFTFIAPDSVATYTLTVRPTLMAAYSGKQPYLDPAPMGTISTQFTVTP